MAGKPAYKGTRMEIERVLKTLIFNSVLSRAWSPLEVFQREKPCLVLYSNSLLCPGGSVFPNKARQNLRTSVHILPQVKGELTNSEWNERSWPF